MCLMQGAISNHMRRGRITHYSSLSIKNRDKTLNPLLKTETFIAYKVWNEVYE